MSGSLEVRQFLLRQEGGEGPGNTGGLPTQRTSAADAWRISDDQVRRASLAVARSANGADDCAQLLDMLGLAPDGDGRSPVQR
jgi:hypothetical protein